MEGKDQLISINDGPDEPFVSKKTKQRGQQYDDSDGLQRNVSVNITAKKGIKIGFMKEFDEERRVSMTPDVGKSLINKGFALYITSGAGEYIMASDEQYKKAGFTVVDSNEELADQCEILVKFQPPTPDEVSTMVEGQILISYLYDKRNPELVKLLADQGVTAISMDAVPRTTKAQKLDSLSSMSKVGGYRAVIEATKEYGHFLNQEIGASGTLDPSKVLIIGGGVAGLAALGIANKLGSITRVFDTRPAVKEEVESLGGEFLMLDFKEDGTGAGGYAKTMSKEFIEAEMKLFAEQCLEVDIIITTAMIPGKPAPKLITKQMVDSMKPGSVICDMAAITGGNCEYTIPGETHVTENGVKIIGHKEWANEMPRVSSVMFSQNIVNLFGQICEKSESWKFDANDEILIQMTKTHRGQVLPPPPEVVIAAPAPKKDEPPPKKKEEKETPFWMIVFYSLLWQIPLFLVLGGIAVWASFSEQIRTVFVPQLFIFTLAFILGYSMIWKVHEALRTPLMSVTNAISGIVLLGGMMALDVRNNPDEFGNRTKRSGSEIGTVVLNAFAVLTAAINVFGGFGVTQRMLQMFVK